MELTKEYFDQKLEEQTRAFMAVAEAQTESLARLIKETVDEPMHQRFDALDRTLAADRKRLAAVETKVQRLEEALHITL